MEIATLTLTALMGYTAKFHLLGLTERLVRSRKKPTRSAPLTMNARTICIAGISLQEIAVSTLQDAFQSSAKAKAQSSDGNK
jgi:hypothetical protein